MTKPLILATADWHAEEYAWVRHPTLKNDSFVAIEHIFKIAKELDIKHIIAAGDLIDKPYPGAYVITKLIKTIEEKCPDDTEVLYIQGQHEAQASPTPCAWLDLSSHSQHIHKQTKDINGLNIYGLDYTRPDFLDQELASVPSSTDIFVCHQVWSDFMNIAGEARFNQIPYSRIVVTGDYHKHLSLRANRVDEEVLILSPGSVCMQSIDEDAQKKVFVINDDLTIDSIKLPSRPVYRAQIKTEDQLNQWIAKVLPTIKDDPNLPEDIAHPIIQVKFKTSLTQAGKIITELTKDKGHLFLQPMNEIKSPVYEYHETNLDMNVSLSKFCSPDSHIYPLAKRLLESRNPDKELELMEKEYITED